MFVDEILLCLSVIGLMAYLFILVMRVYRHLDQIDELLSLCAKAIKEDHEEEVSHD